MGQFVTAEEVWLTVLDGVPTYNLQGQRLPDAVVEGFIAAAENQVELDLDVLLRVRTIKCTNDQGDPDDEDDDAIYTPALDKPRNWFAGDRAGIIILPYHHVVDVQRVTLRPAGFGVQAFDIPVDRLRLTSKGFSLVPGVNGYLFPQGAASLANFWMLQDGRRIPGGLEIEYRAGLGKRGLKQYPAIKTLILLQAAILSLGAANVKLGGGVQQEQVRSDGLDNQVTLQRNPLGPLGGALANLKSSYAAILRSLQSALTSPTTVWLG